MTSVVWSSPKEIRRTLAIREGDPLEIYTTDGGVLFRKYEQPTKTKAATAQKWLEDNALPMRATSAKFSIENKTTTCEVVSNNSRQTGTATATAKDTFIPAVGMDFGMIELFTEDHSFMLDADSFSIPGEINPLD